MAQILLIEADGLMAGNIKKYLGRVGHDVRWHVDPQVAMDAIDAKKPDLLILDLMLANRSGVEFLYEFRSYPDWQKLPIIVYSSVPEAELGYAATESLQQLDIAAYHYKPHTGLAELAQSVDLALQTVPAK